MIAQKPESEVTQNAELYGCNKLCTPIAPVGRCIRLDQLHRKIAITTIRSFAPCAVLPALLEKWSTSIPQYQVLQKPYRSVHSYHELCIWKMFEIPKPLPARPRCEAYDLRHLPRPHSRRRQRKGESGPRGKVGKGGKEEKWGKFSSLTLGGMDAPQPLYDLTGLFLESTIIWHWNHKKVVASPYCQFLTCWH